MFPPSAAVLRPPRWQPPSTEPVHHRLPPEFPSREDEMTLIPLRTRRIRPGVNNGMSFHINVCGIRGGCRGFSTHYGRFGFLNEENLEHPTSFPNSFIQSIRKKPKGGEAVWQRRFGKSVMCVTQIFWFAASHKRMFYVFLEGIFSPPNVSYFRR